MVAVIIFGLGMVTVSIWMIFDPDSWVRSVIQYCRKSYMHGLEIVICLTFGLLFLFFGETTSFPVVIHAAGYVLTIVGVILVFVPSYYHRRFGIWSVKKIGKTFRPLGFLSLLVGAFFIYAAF